ncbi:MAG: 4Fe-4S binding protein [Clostridia bacterium]
MFAVRNIRLCTKDCLCLYVCPTHATDTETGQIDRSKCIGCGMCAKSCPSGAISLVPDAMPLQQEKSDRVVNALNDIFKSKVEQEKIAENIVDGSENELTRKLAEAIRLSNHIMAEDIVREAGYMLPQSDNGINFLKDIIATEQSKEFPKEIAQKLLKTL